MNTTVPANNPGSSLFQQTDAGGIQRAAERDLKALEDLYLKYRDPLRVVLLAKFRSYPAVLRNSEDLLAAFTAEKILSDGWLKKWNPQRGRFRDFLRTSLTNFVWG